MDRSCILIKEVQKYYQTHLLNLFLILFIDNQPKILYRILHSPDNCLMDEYKEQEFRQIQRKIEYTLQA